MPTLIRCWETLRAPEVAKWQQKYRVDWDATDGRNGGAQQRVWEIFLEMERFNGKAKEEDQGTLALVLDLAKAFERVRRVLFEGCVAEPLQTITAILPGSKWSCLLLRTVLQDALSEVTKNYGFCG